MEKLNVKKLYKEQSRETKNVLIEVDKGSPHWINNYFISYYEKNKKTNQRTVISGNKKNGYYKYITYEDDPIKQHFNFYPDGSLRSRATSYIGYLRKYPNGNTGRPNFNFPIGKSYTYDEKGNVTKEVDSDIGYKITYKDLEKIMLAEEKIDLNQNALLIEKFSKEKVNYLFSKIIDKDYLNDSPFWYVVFTMPDDNYSVIVSAKTGKIIFKNKYRVIEP